MKVKKVLKFFAVILGIAVGVFSLIGCSNGSSETEISLFKWDFASLNAARRQNTPIYATLKEKAHGLDLKSITCGYGDWESTINNLYNTQNLPDVFIHYTVDRPQVFRKMVRDEAVLNWNDYVTQEKYPNIYERLHEYKWLVDRIEYLNGGYYFLPITIKQTHVMFVRQDWINNLNAKLPSILVQEGIISSEAQMTDELYETHKFVLPETLLEFYRLAKAFTIYDPDNNGQKDTTGYFSESNKDMDCWVYVAFGTGWNQWVYDEGEEGYVPAELTDESMYATAFINKLMADGYMSKDSITADNGTKQDRFMQGRVGMIYAQNWLNTFVSGLMDVYNCSIEEATAMIAMAEPPAGRDGAYGGAGQNGYWQGYCINARMSEARIAKCLELFDYLYSDEGLELILYGVEGVHYTENADGTKTTLLEANDKGFHTNIQSVDQATQLYGLVYWTGHYGVETVTNGDICAAAMEKSAANRHKEDYPDLQTQSMIDYREGAYDYFWTVISDIENDANGLFAADWTYDAKTFGWDQLYSVSTNLQGKWRSFVSDYKEDYYGQDMIDEYNEYIASGKAQKVNDVS